jgi:hypothetical protein
MEHITALYQIPTDKIIKYSIFKMLDSLNLKEKLTLLDGIERPDAETWNRGGNEEADKYIRQYFNDRTLKQTDTGANIAKERVVVLVDEQMNLVLFSHAPDGEWVQQYNTKPFLEQLKEFVIPVNTINTIFGFMEHGVFKIRDRQNKRNKGFDITKAGKQRTTEILNYFVGVFNRTPEGQTRPVGEYTNDNTAKISQLGLCVIVEMILRYLKEKGKTEDTPNFTLFQSPPIPVVFLTEEEMSIIQKYII